MDDRVCDLGVPRHELVFHHVRDAMCLVEAHVGGHPDVEVEEHVVFGPARSDVMAAEHSRHAYDDLLDVLVQHHNAEIGRAHV